MIAAEFAQMCRDICPHCNAGIVARQRPDTQEWTHFVANEQKKTMSTMICFATYWRNKNQDQVIG